MRLHARFGVAAAVLPGGLAVAVDGVVAAGAPSAVGQVNLLLVWWTLWQLGIARSYGWKPNARHAAGLLCGGAVLFALLVIVAGYPAGAVGGTGGTRSNLAPPSAAALALALAQVGAVLVAAPAVRGIANRVVIGWVNARALPIFLLHQSALTIVVLLAGGAGMVAGLHTVPDDPGWLLARLCWLPVFAATLVVLLVALRRLLDHPRRTTAGH